MRSAILASLRSHELQIPLILGRRRQLLYADPEDSIAFSLMTSTARSTILKDQVHASSSVICATVAATEPLPLS